MKKSVLLIFFLLALNSCSNDADVISPNQQINYRQVAFNSLSQQSKTEITDWQNGKVELGRYRKINGVDWIIFDSGNKYTIAVTSPGIELTEGQNLVAVYFQTKDDALLGPIIIIVEPGLESVVGIVPRN